MTSRRCTLRHAWRSTVTLSEAAGTGNEIVGGGLLLRGSKILTKLLDVSKDETEQGEEKNHIKSMSRSESIVRSIQSNRIGPNVY
ncbi:hypothetical protein C4D60_Mb06t11740 [Musa balbisiana]|uniref:Uncharacterized protein n=1 Tax=Musa balbisiana TaxID=52838 RepID=A0A4S8IMC5_MUSBA|nr:hypothetical protein C4D60_Mb06t11740 [Musa balbisiana]